MGEARDSLEDITKKKKFAVGVTEERKETKFCEGGEGNGRHINADRLRRGKNGTNNVDGCHEGVSGDNEMEESVDSRKGGCVGPYFIIYVYLVSSYRPSHSPLSKSLLLHHLLKVSGVFRGCGGVVVKAEGVAGVVYRVGKVIQVWVGRGEVVGGVVVRAAGVWGVVYKVGKCRAEPGFGPTPPLQ